MPQKQYLDDNGNPIAAPQKQYLDDSGNPVVPKRGAAPNNPTVTISAALPRNAEGWFADAERDLRQGGSRTAVGRILGHLQGRGDKGYSGLESGVSKGTAEFMGSPELGALQVAKGGTETATGHPVKGAGNIIGGVLKAGTIPGAMMAGPEAKAAEAIIPSTERAGQILNSVEQVAKDVPVALTDTHTAINEFLKHAESGGTQPKVITDLLRRITPKNGVSSPLTYEDARRFYQNISRMSDAELSTLNPNMRRLMGGIKEAFKKDIGDAADLVGQKANYYKGLKEYAKAAKLERAAAEMKKWAIRAAGTAALGAAAYKGAKMAGGVGKALMPQ